MNAVLLVALALLRAAAKQVLIAVISDRLLKDVLIVGLEKLSKRTDNHVDDDTVLLIKRALYPDFQAGEPPSLEALDVAAKKIEDNTK